MNSCKSKASEALASSSDRKPNLAALVELANLPDDRTSFDRFARRWPGFVRMDESWWLEVIRAFVETPAFLPPEFVDVYRRREALRLIWRGDSEMLTHHLLERDVYEDKDTEGRTINLSRSRSLTFDWQRSQIMYKAQTEFQSALYALFRQSRLAKVCANPECPAPYFIAERTAQRYHSDCAQVFQRQWKLQWWKEHGSKWRRNRSRGKRGKR